MLRMALVLCGAGLLIAGCQAQAKANAPSPSRGIPELITRCVDGRDVAGQVANCSRAVEAKVGSEDLQDLARFGLALAREEGPAPGRIPQPILRCLYSFDVDARLASCTKAIDSGAGTVEMQAMAHHARAIAHCLDRHPERSIADETQAIALVPNFPEAYAHRAECRQALGDLDGARADQDEAIRLAPDVPGYYSEAATTANLAGDHDAALKHLEYAIRAWPHFNTVVDLRAKTLFNLGRYDEAVLAFTQTVQAFPGDERAVLWLHLARLRAGQPDAAEFAANTAKLHLTGWAKLLFEYYEGRAEYGPALLASRASDEPDAECMAHLFIAEHLLAKRDETAPMFFGGAASTCSPQTAPTSRMAAWAELRKISPELQGNRWTQ